MLPAVSRRRGTAPLLRRSLRMQILKTTRGPPPSHSATDFPIRNQPAPPPVPPPSHSEIPNSSIFHLILLIDSVTIPAGSPAMLAATHIRHSSPHLFSKIPSFRINTLHTQFQATPVFSSDCAFPRGRVPQLPSHAFATAYELPSSPSPTSRESPVTVLVTPLECMFMSCARGGAPCPEANGTAFSSPPALSPRLSTTPVLLPPRVPPRMIPPPQPGGPR